MVFKGIGEAAPGFFVLGAPQVPVYLLDGRVPVFFDGGMAHLGREYVAHALEILGPRQPALLLHTHMHFDHCGATAQLKRAFPALRLGASKIGAEILAKPKARELIRELNDDARRAFGVDAEGVVPVFEPFELDLTLEDGDEIDVGGGETLQVIATPGHTRDFLSYYLPSRKILVASEAAGCAHHSGQIMVEFASDYDAYLNSIEKLLSLDAQALAQGHHCVFLGQAVRKFLEDSRALTLGYRARAEELLDELHGDIDAVVARFKAEEWEPLPMPRQPGPAYLLNTYGRVRNLAARRKS